MVKQPRRRIKSGDVFKVPLGDDYHGYGVLLDYPLCAFLDERTVDERNLDAIRTKRVLFKVCVFRRAFTSGIWPFIGNVELTDEMKLPVFEYQQDMHTNILTITLFNSWYLDDDFLKEHEGEHKASYDECKELEAASVWEPEAIAERLDDHFSGRKNAYLEHDKTLLEAARTS